MASKGTNKQILCAICNDIYKDPKLLPCLHTFCKDCIIQHSFGSNAEYTCHTCQETFQHGENSVTKLKPNTVIASLVEMEKLKTAQHVCVVCSYRDKQDNATRQCLDCGDMLCDTCSEHHTYTKLTIDHEVVKLTDVRKGQYDDAIRHQRSIRCGRHSDQYDCTIKYYCRTCYCPVCEKCISEHRSGHDLITNEEALRMSKVNAITELYNELQPRLRQALDVQHSVKTGIHGIEKEEKEIPRKIQSFSDKFKKLVDNKGKEVKKTVMTELSESKQTLLAQKSKSDAYLAKLQPSMAICKELLSGQSDVQIMPIEDMLLTKLTTWAAIERPSDDFEIPKPTFDLQTSVKDAIYVSVFKRKITAESKSPPACIPSTNDSVESPIAGNSQHKQSVCTAQAPAERPTKPDPDHSTKDYKSIPQTTEEIKPRQCTTETIRRQKDLPEEIKLKPSVKQKIPSQQKEEKDTKQKSIEKDKMKMVPSEKKSKDGCFVNADPSKQRSLEKDKSSHYPTSEFQSEEVQRRMCGSTVVNKYNLVRCFGLETGYDSSTPRISSVAWLNSDSFVVSDIDNNKVSVYNQNGELKWGMPVNDPWNVCCVNEVIACSQKGHIIFIKDKKLLTIIRMQNNGTPLLAKTSDDLILATSTYNRQQMETFTASGAKVGHIQIDNHLGIDMISSNEDWHIASNWYSNNLLFINKNSGSIAKERVLPEPRKWGHHGGHCYDGKSILVADYHGGKVLVLSKDGQHLQSLSLPASVRHPVDVDFNLSGRLVVAGTNSVAIYALKM